MVFKVEEVNKGAFKKNHSAAVAEKIQDVCYILTEHLSGLCILLQRVLVRAKWCFSGEAPAGLSVTGLF